MSPESFTFWESVVVLACVVLGGMGHIPGVILGAVLLAVFPEFLRSTMGPLQNAIFGHEIVDTEVIRQLLYGLAMVADHAVSLGRPVAVAEARRQDCETGEARWQEAGARLRVPGHGPAWDQSKR